MSLPQTEWNVPPGGHASVKKWASGLFKEVAVVSQVVGFAELSAEGGADDGLEEEVFGEGLLLEVWFSFFSLEQPSIAKPIMKSASRLLRFEFRDIMETPFHLWGAGWRGL